MLSYAAANVGFVTLKLPARGAVAFVCSCQVICQFCQRDVKNASAEALSTSADFFAGWRLTPYPAYSPKSLLALSLGPLKLPVLAASTSLRRSRQAGAARMDAG